MGRKKVDNSKREAVHVRLGEGEYRSLVAMARQEQRSISEMVRFLILEGARSRSYIHAKRVRGEKITSPD